MTRAARDVREALACAEELYTYEAALVALDAARVALDAARDAYRVARAAAAAPEVGS